MIDFDVITGSAPTQPQDKPAAAEPTPTLRNPEKAPAAKAPATPKAPPSDG